MILLASQQTVHARDVENNFHFRHKASLVGSWQANIDFFGTPAPALYSFQRGGTLTESDNPGFDPNFNDNALSPGIGSWKREGHRNYIATYRKLAFNENGEFQQIYTATMNAKVDKGGILRGTLNIVISLPDGTQVGEIPDLTFTATRITIDY